MSRSAMPRRSRRPPRCWRASSVKGRPYVSLLGSRKQFLDRRRARIVRLRRPRPHRRVLLSGGQIDGHGNINLVRDRRSRPSEGALPRLVRLGLSLLRGAQGDLVPHRTFAPHTGAGGRLHQRAGRQRAERVPHRRADRAHHQPLPISFADGRFTLTSVHPGHTVEEVIEHTGFEFDRPETVPETPPPSPETLKLMRETVAPQLAEVYPQFAAKSSASARRLSRGESHGPSGACAPKLVSRPKNQTRGTSR